MRAERKKEKKKRHAHVAITYSILPTWPGTGGLMGK